MTILFTIGYEATAPSDFMATLAAAGISTLLDIRDAPVSRRSGFSKRELAAVLEAAGIAYVHLRGLGNPRAGREAAKAGQREAYVRIFTEHLKSEEATRDMALAAGYALAGGACLMCYERDHQRCHRDIVADRLAEQAGLTLHHLKAALGAASPPSFDF